MSTQILTDDDLRVIESLDFAPPCDPPLSKCSSEATWAVVTTAKCGHDRTRTLCGGHLRQYLAQFDRDWGEWMCATGCLSSDRDFVTIVRIEAL